MGEEIQNKGRLVCVTGGTGFLGSWMVKTLLQLGYSVNTTTRIDPEEKKELSYLKKLAGASERLQIFEADLDRPDSFAPAIQGCIGVFHTAHPLDFEERETEEVKVKRVTDGTIGILHACLDSKTVRRVVLTSSIAAVVFDEKIGGAAAEMMIDESCWSDVELVRSLGLFGGAYMVTKTLAERAAIDFAERNGLDLVTVLPSWIHGPFICSYCPDSVDICMALISGKKKLYQRLVKTSLVHVDDVVRAHIHLFEFPNAKGRYICSYADIKIDNLHRFLSATYPEYELPTTDSLKDLIPVEFPEISSKKLLETGFEFENGLKEMFDGAIKSFERMGLL